MSETLTEYESRAVRLIAEWKARTPSRVSRALQVVRWPVGKVMGKVVPGPGVQKICDKIEVLLEHRSGLAEIAQGRRARRRGAAAPFARGVRPVGPGGQRPAQREAILEGATAGVAGIAGEAMHTPVLIGAAVRAIRRIGHCYGYRLDTELDRQYVLGILELSTVEDPVGRKRIRERLYRLMHQMDEGEPPIGFDGIKKELTEDLVIEAVPIVGMLVSVVVDYAYMRRVDFAARRVFQRRWLRRRGKVTVIAPAEVSRRGTEPVGRLGGDERADLPRVVRRGIRGERPLRRPGDAGHPTARTGRPRRGGREPRRDRFGRSRPGTLAISRSVAWLSLRPVGQPSGMTGRVARHAAEVRCIPIIRSKPPGESRMSIQ